MKWLDSLLHSKETHTKFSGERDVSQNENKKSYRDIGKRAHTLELSHRIFHKNKDNSSPFSWQKYINKLISHGKNIYDSMSLGRWIFILLILFFTYIVYGLGFLMRTADNIRSFIDNPSQIFTSEGEYRIKKLFQDYQIIGFVANNPIIPLEPLATYGNILKHVRTLSGIFHKTLDIQSQLLVWAKESDTQSIFPVIDTLFGNLSEIVREGRSIQSLVGSVFDSHRVQGLDAVWGSLDVLVTRKDTWYTLLGKEKPTRILLLNQNSDELRAGGGFPGTAFILEFDGGRLTKWQFTDIYALDWKLRTYIPSPEGINNFRSIEYPGKPVEFEIRDANYFPLFRESAEKIDEMARLAGIGPIDLVIGINQRFLEDIIKIVEPLELEGVPVSIDHYNAMLILSMLVEAKKTLTAETPKGTVKSLGKIIFQKLQNEHKINQALSILAVHIIRGEVIAGSPRADIQGSIDELGILERWNGKKGDWVYPLFTSISRNKSDRLMERTFLIERINACERILTLSQKHWYDLTERNRIVGLANKLGLVDKIKILLPIQGGGDNVQYLRFILPPGTAYLPQSETPFSLLENTSSYTTIHGYEMTKPGTTSTMSIRYVLPDGYCSEKTEFFKQPGLSNTRVQVKKGGQIIYQKFYE